MLIGDGVKLEVTDYNPGKLADMLYYELRWYQHREGVDSTMCLQRLWFQRLSEPSDVAVAESFGAPITYNKCMAAFFLSDVLRLKYYVKIKGKQRPWVAI